MPRDFLGLDGGIKEARRETGTVERMRIPADVHRPAVSAKELQPSTAHPTGKLKPYHLRLAKEEMERRGVLGGMKQSMGTGSGTGAALRSRKGLFRR